MHRGSQLEDNCTHSRAYGIAHSLLDFALVQSSSVHRLIFGCVSWCVLSECC